jgi:hypothetical protein
MLTAADIMVGRRYTMASSRDCRVTRIREWDAFPELTWVEYEIIGETGPRPWAKMADFLDLISTDSA